MNKKKIESFARGCKDKNRDCDAKEGKDEEESRHFLMCKRRRLMTMCKRRRLMMMMEVKKMEEQEASVLCVV